MSLRRVLFGFLALTLMLSAYGDDGGGDGDQQRAATPPTPLLTTPTTTPPPTTPTATRTTTTRAMAASRAGAFGDEDCTILLSIAVAVAALGTGGEGFDAEGFEEIRSQLDAVAEDAPDDVADSLEVIKDTTDEVAELMADVDTSNEDFTDPEFQQAFTEALSCSAARSTRKRAKRSPPFATEECNLTAGANN